MLDFLTPSVREPEVAEAALAGLLKDRKTLPAKLFYDDEGCRLFGEITRLPEYYVTRTELALLADIASDFGAIAPRGSALVEYGASCEDKAQALLAAMHEPRAYVPIDVAAAALRDVAARMAGGAVAVHPVAGDFLDDLTLPAAVATMPRVGFFPGSTIGNFDPDQASHFLAQARETLMGPGGSMALFLVGVDLRKSPEILIPAYDDASGVTAAFNRNLLVRLNREANADFDLSSFRHEARWNDGDSRIEMHLVSTCDQVVHVAGHAIAFADGETIHTENSYKHSVEGFQALAESAGWRVRRVWVDQAGLVFPAYASIGRRSMRRTNRAIAVVRREERPSLLPWVVLALVALAATAAHAQVVQVQATDGKTMPPAISQPSGDIAAGTGMAGGNLSHGGNGVITPPASVDPGMTVARPSADAFPTPTVRPRVRRAATPRLSRNSYFFFRGDAVFVAGLTAEAAFGVSGLTDTALSGLAFDDGAGLCGSAVFDAASVRFG